MFIYQRVLSTLHRMGFLNMVNLRNKARYSITRVNKAQVTYSVVEQKHLRKSPQQWLVNRLSQLISMGDLQDPKMEVRKRTIFQAIFCGDIPLYLKISLYMVGTSNLGS